MGGGVTIKDTDAGYNALVKRVFGLRRPVVSVGILEKDAEEPHGENTTLADVATWMEFGFTMANGQEVGPRSFIRAWFDENQTRAHQVIRVLMEQVVAGRYDADTALNRFGQWCVGEMQKRISQGIPPPNAESTIARKGSSTPLIDTNQLRSGISYAVTEKGRVE